MSKRIFDIVFSIIGLLIIWPVFLVVAILIKIKMPGGPVLFTQKRVGRYGKLFTIYKFRTMIVQHLSDGQVGSGVSISVKGQSRITPLGAVLRRYKIDELPELFNILIGTMSFVGPRPDVPGYADQLQGDDRLILNLRPGLTCEASLKYAHEEEFLAEQANPVWYNDTVIFPDKVKMNLEYLQKHSVWGDIKIIMKTMGV